MFYHSMFNLQHMKTTYAYAHTYAADWRNSQEGFLRNTKTLSESSKELPVKSQCNKLQIPDSTETLIKLLWGMWRCCQLNCPVHTNSNKTKKNQPTVNVHYKLYCINTVHGCMSHLDILVIVATTSLNSISGVLDYCIRGTTKCWQSDKQVLQSYL